MATSRLCPRSLARCRQQWTQVPIERLREAAKHGFKYAIVPFANRPKEAVGKMKVHGVKTLSAALEVLQSL